jgi:hypothetical protein
MQAENAKKVRGFEGGWWVLRDFSVVAHFPLYSSSLSIIVRKKMSFIKQRWDVLLSWEINQHRKRFNCEHSQAAAAAAVAAHILGFLPLLPHSKETDSSQASKLSSPSWALRGQHRQW